MASHSSSQDQGEISELRREAERLRSRLEFERQQHKLELQFLREQNQRNNEFDRQESKKREAALKCQINAINAEKNQVGRENQRFRHQIEQLQEEVRLFEEEKKKAVKRIEQLEDDVRRLSDKKKKVPKKSQMETNASESPTMSSTENVQPEHEAEESDAELDDHDGLATENERQAAEGAKSAYDDEAVGASNVCGTDDDNTMPSTESDGSLGSSNLNRGRFEPERDRDKVWEGRKSLPRTPKCVECVIRGTDCWAWDAELEAGKVDHCINCWLRGIRCSIQGDGEGLGQSSSQELQELEVKKREGTDIGMDTGMGYPGSAKRKSNIEKLDQRISRKPRSGS